ncbi:MAG: autotransporter-associated beta strand repeat-containing protein [Akkermansiaceae bacterium]|nr:autotransporter-associated beta strand repeat-containing protein [Akkermansiaceae bacterium]MCP5545871.1 autotransporter-associated beta strand repeat-containing protein [Akkermansiaceae bacterium]
MFPAPAAMGADNLPSAPEMIPKFLLVLALGSSLCLAQSPPASFTRTVTNGIDTVTVDYVLHSVRGPNFSILVQDSAGALNAHSPAESRIYLGTVQGHPGAMAAGLLKADDTLITRVTFETGVEWTSTGGVASVRGNTNWTPAWPGATPGSGGAGSDVWAAEVGIDASYRQFLGAGSDVDATVEISEFAVMSTNLLYLRDAAIVHRIGRLIVRADQAQDPYEPMGGDTGLLLPGVKDQWNNVLPASTHDLAMVARPGAGGGLAWVGAIGTSNRYSANGASSNGDFNVIWRHEAGHNWGAGHFEGGTPEGPTIMSGNALGRMSSPELYKILNHRNTNTAVLDNLGPYSFSLPPRASADPVKFDPEGGAVAIDVLDNDSDSNGDTISILSFDTTSHRGAVLALSAGTGPGGRDEIQYTPPVNFLDGTDYFQYRIGDGTGREAVGWVMLEPEFSSEMLAHWNFDENAGATAKDASIGFNDAAVSGTPGWNATGREHACLTVNGTDNWATCASIDFNTNTLTIAGWIRRSGTQNDWAGIAFSRAGGTVGFNFGGGGDANELRYHWGGGGNSSYYFNSDLLVPDGVWTFCALVVEPTQATLYMKPDGGPMETAVSTGTFSPNSISGGFRIGGDSNSSTRTFNGDIDELRVFQRSLSAAEIDSLAGGGGTASNPVPGRGGALTRPITGDLQWKAPPSTVSQSVFLGTTYTAVESATTASSEYLGDTATPSWSLSDLPEGVYYWRVDCSDGVSTFEGPVWYFEASDDIVDGLVGWWRMEEGDGPVALDSSPSGAEGTLDLPAWTAGRRGGGLLFDGNDRVECGTGASLSGTTPLTLAAWVKVDNGYASSAIVVQQRDVAGFNGEYQLSVRANGTVGFFLYGDSSTQFDFSGATAVNDGQWHHVAATRDGAGNATIYVDGAVDGSVTGTTVRSLSPSISVGIGCDTRDSNKHFHGSIDDVRIYGRLLSQTEVQSVRNRAPFFANAVISGADASDGVSYTSSIASEADDYDADEALVFSKTSGPAWLEVAPDGSLGGTPLQSDVGPNVFTVEVADALGVTASAQLEIEVLEQNDPPAFDSDPLDGGTVFEGIAYSGTLDGTATDPDVGDTLEFSYISGPAWLTVLPDGSLSGTPSSGDLGLNVFTVRVTDFAGLWDEATLNITVLDADPSISVSSPAAGPVVPSGGIVDITAAAYGGMQSITGVEFYADGALLGSDSNAPFEFTWNSPAPGPHALVARLLHSGGQLDSAPVSITVAGDQPMWINPAGGSWPVAGNWLLDDVADGDTEIADFSRLDLTADTVVTLDGARAIAGLWFADTTPSHNWTLADGGGGPLTLHAAGTPVMDAADGTTTISVPLAGTLGFEKTGVGALVLTGVGTWTGSTLVSDGTLEVQQKSGDVPYVISQGATLRVGYNTGLGYTPGLTIHGNGVSDPAGLYVLDGRTLASNSGILFDTAPSTIRSYGGGNASIRGFDVNSAWFLRNTAAASGSVVDASIGVQTGYYGYRMQTDAGAATATGDITIEGVISGSGGAQTAGMLMTTGLSKWGDGSLRLTGASTYSHATAVNRGTLVLSGGDDRLPVGTTVVLGNGTNAGKLVLDGISQTVAGLHDHGTATPNSVVGSSSPGTLDLDLAADSTFGGVLGGPDSDENNLSFTKRGVGALTLTGAHSYTGATDIEEGALWLASGASLDLTATTVSAGATLGGEGSIAGDVALSGTLAPAGDAIGSFPIGGTLTAAPGSSLAIEIDDWNGVAGTNFDQVAATSLDITANSGEPFVIDFDDTAIGAYPTEAKSLLIIAAGSVSGFDPSVVSLNVLSGNATGWSVAADSSGLSLVYQLPNTEPSFAGPIDGGSHPAGQLLSGDISPEASDPDVGDTLTFSLTSGPVWLTVLPDGSYSGTPGLLDGGVHIATVRVTDTGTLFDETTLTITVTLTPYQQWLVDTYGVDAENPSLAGDLLDPDHDTLTNLEEHAFGTDGDAASARPITARFEEGEEPPGFRMIIDRNPLATDVEFVVEGTSDPSLPGSWTTAGLVIDEDTPTRLTVRDTIGGAKRFLRLRLVRVP